MNDMVMARPVLDGARRQNDAAFDGFVRTGATLEMNNTNATGSTITLDGSASVLWDEVGCALLTPLSPFGRMAGTSSLGCLVRFSKLPEASDIGWGGGAKRYGVNFELTEV